jgi:hypothetical protein
MDKVKLARSMGIVGALLVPAVVVAQQFRANEPLLASDLALLVTKVDDLTARVTALETAPQTAPPTGPGAQEFARIEADGIFRYTARADGFIGVVPGGTGFGVVDVQARINGTDADRHFRASNGDTFNAIVSDDDILTLTVGAIVAPANVTLYWYPLRRSGQIPECEIAGCGLPL